MIRIKASEAKQYGFGRKDRPDMVVRSATGVNNPDLRREGDSDGEEPRGKV